MRDFAHATRASSTPTTAPAPTATATRPQIRHILRSPRVQPKLRVGAPNDPAEHEAARIADQVMRMPEPSVATASAPVGVQRLCAECEQVQRQPIEEEEELLQTKEIAGRTPVVTPRIAADIAAMRGRGEPLPASECAFFGPRFGRDFSQVRIHTGPAAIAAARAIGARAFTVGDHIAFGRNEYRPESNDGRQLIAHELTHTQQQSDADPPVRRDLLAYETDRVETPGPQIELEPKEPEISARFEGNGPEIEAALASLIRLETVALRRADGAMYFSVAPDVPNKRTLDFIAREIRRSLHAAGFAKAPDMAQAITQRHATSLYSGQRIISVGQMTSRESDLVVHQLSRPLTNFELSEARMVYRGGLDLSNYKVVENPIGSIGGYVRAVRGALMVPPGFPARSRFMPLLIHELMHEWQYQHGYSVLANVWRAITKSYDYGGEPALIAAAKSGSSITSFNTEQQGEIMEDLYERTKSRKDVAAWMPFVQEVRNG